MIQKEGNHEEKSGQKEKQASIPFGSPITAPLSQHAGGEKGQPINMNGEMGRD